MRYCDCEGWEKNLERISLKDMKEWKTCPYCGKELKGQNENIQNNESLLLG
jgi:uncharacterized Zn-finger protein